MNRTDESVRSELDAWIAILGQLVRISDHVRRAAEHAVEIPAALLGMSVRDEAWNVCSTEATSVLSELKGLEETVLEVARVTDGRLRAARVEAGLDG